MENASRPGLMGLWSCFYCAKLTMQVRACYCEVVVFVGSAFVGATDV